MQLIGITGGIGSGKSALCAELAKMGYAVYDSDRGARHIIDTNPCVRSQVEMLFGSDIYLPSGLDRKRVGQMVFADSNLRKRLNAVVHPAVKHDVEQWMAALPEAPWAFLESAILFETEFDKLCTYTVAVSAPETLRAQRIAQRDGLPPQAVLARMHSQLDDADIRRKANMVLCNDGSTSLAALSQDLINWLKK